MPMLLLFVLVVTGADGGIPPSTVSTPNPPWPASYDLKASSIAMPCNYTGYMDAAALAGFGLVSFDWSNGKKLWANTKPMDAERRMVEQAAMTKAGNPDGHVWVYRNLVKALPWMRSVREKLEDPAYSGFFLSFDPARRGQYHVPDCDNNYDPPLCSKFYHDQEQTPQRNGSLNDGHCEDKCDCGSLPCGEYLFDHRNGTMLQEFLVNEYILGPDGVGNANISGVFIDDFWCYNTRPGECTDPVQGASEEDSHQQVDMGLDDKDIKAISMGWRSNMDAVHRALVKHEAYAWDLFPNQHDAGCGTEPLITKDNCQKILERECDAYDVVSQSARKSNPVLRDTVLYYGFHVNGSSMAGTAEQRLPHLMEDLASFLMIRGDYAYLGYGFIGCAADVNYTQPEIMSTHPGHPLGNCAETSIGVFKRMYSNAVVTMDCSNDHWIGKVEFKGQIVV